MKIFYDHQIFYWQEYGGISRYFCELASRLAKFDDMDVKIVAGVYINKYLIDCPPNLVAGYYIPPIPKSWRMRVGFNALFCSYWRITKSPDIVHETYYLLNKKGKADKEAKKVITIHDMLYEKFGYLLPKSNLICSQKEKAIREADHIICVSENTKRDLLERFDIQPSKVSVVYHGNSLKAINYQQIPHPQFFTPGHSYILYVGQRQSYKNFEKLLQAYANYPNIKNNFHLVCFGGGAFTNEELQLIHRLGLSEQQVIQISGDDNILANLYSKASAFVYPSLYEGFGIPLLEAMACDCPVVCSNTSSMPEVASSAAEYFDPYDPESIAHSLENVLFSSEKAQLLIKQGQERVKYFSWDKCAEQTRSIYLSLM